jgi:hypothetical protein
MNDSWLPADRPYPTPAQPTTQVKQSPAPVGTTAKIRPFPFFFNCHFQLKASDEEKSPTRSRWTGRVVVVSLWLGLEGCFGLALAGQSNLPVRASRGLGRRLSPSVRRAVSRAVTLRPVQLLRNRTADNGIDGRLRVGGAVATKGQLCAVAWP